MAGEVTKRCFQSWLNNSTLVCDPKCGGGGGVAGSHYAAYEYSCAYGAQINCVDLTPHLTFVRWEQIFKCCQQIWQGTPPNIITCMGNGNDDNSSEDNFENSKRGFYFDLYSI
jgi:hypothetical protein